MHWPDHVFILLLLIAQPIHGAWSFRSIIRRIRAGESIDVGAVHRETMVFQGVALLVLMVFWYWARRPASELGLVMPGGVNFIIGMGLVILMCVFLELSRRQVKALDHKGRQKHIEPLGDVVHLLPRNAQEMRTFAGVSVTAGVVEEIIYRGFAMWYLLHLMPLSLAVLASSVLFALGHAYQGWSGGVKTGFVGLAFALLYAFTGSIWLPIAAHILLDLLQGRIVVELVREPTVPESA